MQGAGLHMPIHFYNRFTAVTCSPSSLFVYPSIPHTPIPSIPSFAVTLPVLSCDIIYVRRRSEREWNTFSLFLPMQKKAIVAHRCLAVEVHSSRPISVGVNCRPIAPSAKSLWEFVHFVAKYLRYDTIRDAILTCVQKPTSVSFARKVENGQTRK